MRSQRCREEWRRLRRAAFPCGIRFQLGDLGGECPRAPRRWFLPERGQGHVHVHNVCMREVIGCARNGIVRESRAQLDDSWEMGGVERKGRTGTAERRRAPRRWFLCARCRSRKGEGQGSRRNERTRGVHRLRPIYTIAFDSTCEGAIY